MPTEARSRLNSPRHVVVGHAQVLSKPRELPICLPDVRQRFAVYIVAKQGCNAHVGKAISLQPRLQLLLSDIRGDDRVRASTRIARAVHIVIEHPCRLESGDHNTQPRWQCVHLYVVVWVGSLVKPSLPEGSSVMCRKSASKAQACLDPAEVVYLDRLRVNCSMLYGRQPYVENK